ncbi:MAG: SDR family NAD(P)-dependent oxidoreductase [Burkholderiaceae bacterium]
MITGALPFRFRRPRVALVGSGDIGARLMRTFGGSQVRGPKLLPVSRRLGWDLDQPAIRARLSHWATHSIVLVPPSEQGTIDLRSRRLASAWRAARANIGLRGMTAASGKRQRGVYISTTGVYGDHQGAVVVETSPCLTKQPRSLRRLDAERQWRALGFHVLRVPGISGPERLPIERLRAGMPALLPDDDVYTNHIDADDLAQICWRALWTGRPSRITNAVMPDHLKMGDYFEQVARHVGLPVPRRISRSELQNWVQQGRVSPMMMSFMQDSRQVQSQRLASELGVRLRRPTVAAILADYRS